MTEPRRFPFGGVPVYNPQSLSKREAIEQFRARQAVYQSLMDRLREERPSHVLIIGTRGMGKTTLLQRVRYGVEDDPQLNGRYIVLAFPEEQYDVNRLHHFLLNTAEALADAMERIRNEPMFKRADKFAKVAGKLSQEEIEEQVPKFLAEVGRELRRNLLLLVDNADRLFDTIDKQEQWRLRELLSSRRDLTLIGATTKASEGIYGTDRAFFEFFQIQILTPLTTEEVRGLLLQLSDAVKEEEGEKGAAKRRVEEWLVADRSRLPTLVRLTGGNPRTTVLLFHLVLDGLAGGAREYLEQLLDQCTPTYKGRMDELPSQAQQVLDAVALQWDPVTAMEVGEVTGLETNAVSTQLTRLWRQGLLEKADPGDSKKVLYQVAERFFNIWYLMRSSRRVRAKLRWFVEFLRVFFESGELEQMAWERLGRFRSAGRGRPAEFEDAFAYVLASGADRDKVEGYLRQECADMEPAWRPLLDLIRSSVNLALEGTSSGHASVEGRLDILRTSPAESEATARKATEFNGEVEAALRKAIELDPTSAISWNSLGYLLIKMPERADEAEEALRKAIEFDPKPAGLWYNLGNFLQKTPARKEEAEAAFRKAIEIYPGSAWFWNGLGEVLSQTSERRDEAEEAYRKAIDLDPKHDEFWNNLGILLERTIERSGEAEGAYRKAIEIDPRFAGSWHNLGNLLRSTPGRREEAEVAYRKAIELNPKSGVCWYGLGALLACQARKPKEAELALRRSVELEPDNALSLYNLGVLLYCELAREEEAMQYLRRAHQLDPTDSVFVATLKACIRGSEDGDRQLPAFIDASRGSDFWDELLAACQKYPPFGKILIGICDLVQQWDSSNGLALLHRAVALAQLDDFPRASVALEDALTGDPIEQLSVGRRALEVFFAGAVRNGRVRDCLKLLDKKEWKDAWRPIYEALRAVEEGSGEYLKRVAVEIREPAQVFLRRIAPELPGVPARAS